MAFDVLITLVVLGDIPKVTATRVPIIGGCRNKTHDSDGLEYLSRRITSFLANHRWPCCQYNCQYDS